MTKKWTLISQTVTDHIKVPKTATNVNITRQLNNANNDWSSIAKIVNKYEIKNGTHNSVIQRIRDIKSGKITKLSEITGSSSSGGGSSSSDTGSGDGEGETGDGSSSDGGSSGDTGPLNSSVSKVPITDRDEAMDFALCEWNKIRRTSGHTLECQVFGSPYWKVGEWCKVYLPTFNEYTDMYITKVDNSNDSGSEWLTSLTLMDYAPQLSSVDESELEEDESGDGSDDGSTEDGTDGEEQGESEWTQIVKVLEENYEKPGGGWNDIIKGVRDAKTYDPDIRSLITPLKKKSSKSYVDVGHELCGIMGIGY